MRKVDSKIEFMATQRHDIRASQETEAWWYQVPKKIPARTIEINRGRVFGINGIEYRNQIGSAGQFFSISDHECALLELLFSEIDGVKRIYDIYSTFLDQKMNICEEDFKSLVEILARHHGVLRLG